MRDLKVWIGIALAALTGLIVPACREYLDLRGRVLVIETTQKYLFGTVHVPPQGEK